MSPSIRLQPRDLTLFAELGEVGLLDTTAIHDRHFAADHTGKACLRRLALYARHGLVEPIAASVSFGLPRGGRLPAIHRLTPRGAEVLASLTGASARRIVKGNPKPETLLHRLGCAKLQLLVGDACRCANLAPPAWIAEYDALPGATLQSPLPERFVLCQSYAPPSGKCTCWPDAAALVQIPGTAGASHPLAILFEVDRSTETLRQVAGKLPGYAQLLAQGGWKKFWPEVVKPTVRVFFVTPSEQRLDNIAAAIRDLPGAEAVRLATVERLRPDTFFNAAIWQTVSGESRSIIRATTSAA